MSLYRFYSPIRPMPAFAWHIIQQEVVLQLSPMYIVSYVNSNATLLNDRRL